jgi:prepilin-type N-terminal cleavage/methylation domain-containing protein
MHYQRRSGFTLIELSIVLVIIGLLAGGVLVGRHLIRAAEMKTIVSDVEKFETAINTYRLKFNALAGDHTRAEEFFGASVTDNGDGDGFIRNDWVNNESWLFWQHLALAGFIAGSYSGAPGPNDSVLPSGNAVLRVNVPATRVSGVGYSLYLSPTSNYDWAGINLRSYLLPVGRDGGTPWNYLTWGGWLPATEAASFDQKYDDGIANSGRIHVTEETAGHGVAGCTSGVSPNYQYLSGGAGTCTPFFNLDL